MACVFACLEIGASANSYGVLGSASCTALSSCNTTNFLTSRYPKLLRYACMKMTILSH